MTQKETAKNFLLMAGMGKVDKAYESFTHPQMIHHNPYFKGDRQSLMDAMKEDHQNNPNKHIDIKHIYEDGDKVMTHSLVIKEAMEIVVIHVFRFENGLVVELWDLGQVIDPNSPNENGLF